MRVNSAWDQVGKTIALLGLSVPGFWLGLVMILVFSVWLEWLPTSGQGDWRNLVMPAIALGWYFAASLLRLNSFKHARGTAQRIHQAGAIEGAAGLRGDRDLRVQERSDPRY